MKKPLSAGYPDYCAECPNYRPKNKLIDRCHVFLNSYRDREKTHARWNPILNKAGKCIAFGIVNGNRPAPPEGK